VVLDTEQAGGTAAAWRADLSEEGDVVAAIAAAMARFERLDVLHNNAALTDSDFLTRDTAVTDLSLDVCERTMAVNLRSQMPSCKRRFPDAAERWRLHRQHVVRRLSEGRPDAHRLRSVEGGGDALTMYVATSHGKEGIRVNTIVPGLIITDAVRAHLDAKMLAGLGEATLTPYPGPDDIADLVVFLVSDESRYITGQMIVIDGGMSADVGLGGDG